MRSPPNSSGGTIGRMFTAESIARFASLLADRSRAAMWLALLDGRAWTAGELARVAGVGRSTASEHLTLLVAEGLLRERRQGRHRYVQIADPRLADALETLLGAVGQPSRPTSLRTVRASERLAAARVCYDHLAGALGVAVLDGLVAADLVAQRDGIALTAAGRSWVADLAGPTALRTHGARPLLRVCLDWTERRDHLGGTLGALLCREFVERGWIVRTAGQRAVTVTPLGDRALSDLLGITVVTPGATPRPGGSPADRSPAVFG